jgi:protein O-GlcNAc transferase
MATTLVTALTFHQAGRVAEAAAAYQSILAAEPQNVDALYLFGILARQVQQPVTAIGLIRQAIALKEGVPQFHNHLGAAFLDIGDTNEAQKAFMRALHLRPRYIEAMLNLADLLVKIRKGEEAAACYYAALRLEPNHPDAKSRLVTLFGGLPRAKN